MTYGNRHTELFLGGRTRQHVVPCSIRAAYYTVLLLYQIQLLLTAVCSSKKYQEVRVRSTSTLCRIIYFEVLYQTLLLKCVLRHIDTL